MKNHKGIESGFVELKGNVCFRCLFVGDAAIY